jgi:hypothetical protein
MLKGIIVVLVFLGFWGISAYNSHQREQRVKDISRYVASQSATTDQYILKMMDTLNHGQRR